MLIIKNLNNNNDLNQSQLAEITGKEVSGAMHSEKANKSLPGARSMNLMDPRARSMTRTSQVNTTYTSPNFYTPFTQRQKLFRKINQKIKFD